MSFIVMSLQKSTVHTVPANNTAMVDNALRQAWRLARSCHRRVNQQRGAIASRARSLASRSNPKVFCVGRNKTGTTSLAAALRMLGYRVGSQRAAENLMEDWGRRDFRSLISLVHTADAFQDLPFSAAFTYQAMDMAFPGSKFILTIRDSPEQWYRSLARFTQKRLGLDRPYTSLDLKNDPYVHLGWSWRCRELIWGDDAERSVHDEEIQKQHYNEHNSRIKEYFRHRSGDLLVLNVGQPEAMESLCRFLGKPYSGQPMPLLNTT